MQTLLDPAPISLAESRERVERHLRGRSFLFRLPTLVVAENREHALAVLAWAEALFTAAETPGPAARERALEALSDEVEQALAHTPRSALGHTLSATIRVKELPAHAFRGPLAELRGNVARRSFETRRAMLEHAQNVARPVGRALLAACDRTSERNEVLMDALATAFLLARWTTRFEAHWEQGRLNLPVEELARHGVALQELDFRRADPRLRPVVAEQVRWIRSLFHKGWELSTALGWWRGRILAFVLRWNAASLSALEARRFDVARGEPPAGVLRALACGVASLVTTRPPKLSE